MFHYDRDILIHSIGLWLDAGRKRDFSFVSHAHSDHTNRHDRVLATPATLALAEARAAFRLASGARKRPVREVDTLPLDFNSPLKIDGAIVTLFPAGHVLGSAQILIERDGRRLLYSGDFCPQKTSAAEDIEIPHADTLIMECTYGLPEHAFPARDTVIAQLCDFARKTLARGMTPVFLCYALGKGQEVMKILAEAGFAVAAEGETYELARVYERFGIDFGRFRRLDSPVSPDEVVVTPSTEKIEMFLGGRRFRTASVTGWGAGAFSYRARRANVRIPLSDHADFAGLVEYVKAVSPSEVYITHGPDEFAYYVKKEGFKVGSLAEKRPV